MATCPQCSVHGYPDDGSGFTTEKCLVAVAGSISGSRPKILAREGLRLKHSCGWSIVGFVEGRHLSVPAGEPLTVISDHLPAELQDAIDCGPDCEGCTYCLRG